MQCREGDARKASEAMQMMPIPGSNTFQVDWKAMKGYHPCWIDRARVGELLVASVVLNTSAMLHHAFEIREAQVSDLSPLARGDISPVRGERRGFESAAHERKIERRVRSRRVICVARGNLMQRDDQTYRDRLVLFLNLRVQGPYKTDLFVALRYVLTP